MEDILVTFLQYTSRFNEKKRCETRLCENELNVEVDTFLSKDKNKILMENGRK